MRAPALLVASLVVLTEGCSTPAGNSPSLLPRAVEAIDPRLPVAPLAAPSVQDTALKARLAELVAQGRSGSAAFGRAIGEAERLARSAGPPESESWIVAQQALSAAAAARRPTTVALADIDAIAARQLEQKGTIPPADLTAVQEAASAVGALAREQQERITSISRRLGI